MNKAKAIISAVISLIMVACVVVMCVLGNIYSEQITYWWSGTFTEAETGTEYTADEALENGREVSTEQAAEGIVLLQNNNNALPLSEDERSLTQGT